MSQERLQELNKEIAGIEAEKTKVQGALDELRLQREEFIQQQSVLGDEIDGLNRQLEESQINASTLEQSVEQTRQVESIDLGAFMQKVKEAQANLDEGQQKGDELVEDFKTKQAAAKSKMDEAKVALNEQQNNLANAEGLPEGNKDRQDAIEACTANVQRAQFPFEEAMVALNEIDSELVKAEEAFTEALRKAESEVNAAENQLGSVQSALSELEVKREEAEAAEMSMAKCQSDIEDRQAEHAKIDEHLERMRNELATLQAAEKETPIVLTNPREETANVVPIVENQTEEHAEEDTPVSQETPAETKADKKWWPPSKKVMLGGLAAAVLLMFVCGGILATLMFRNDSEEIVDTETQLKEMWSELEAFKASGKSSDTELEKLREEIATLKANSALVTKISAETEDGATRVEIAEEGTQVIENVIDISFKPRKIESKIIIVTRQGVTVREYQFPGDNEWSSDLHTDFQTTSSFYEDEMLIGDGDLLELLSREVGVNKRVIGELDKKLSTRMDNVDAEIKGLKAGINGINQLLLERLPAGDPVLFSSVDEFLKATGIASEDLFRFNAEDDVYELLAITPEQYQLIEDYLKNKGFEPGIEKALEILLFFKNAKPWDSTP